MNVSPNNRPAQAQAQVTPNGRASAPARTGGVRQAPSGAQPATAPASNQVARKPMDRPDPQSRTEVASSLQRLDAYAESLNERLESAALDAPPEESAAFREVADVLASGLERIRAGIADGSLAPEDVQRGTKVIFERSRQTLQEARKTGPVPSDTSGPGPDATAAAERRGVAPNTDVSATDTDASAPDVDPEAEAEAAEASRALGRSVLVRLENLSSELLSMIDPDAMGDRSGRLYGPTDGAQAITPRDGRMDLAG